MSNLQTTNDIKYEERQRALAHDLKELEAMLKKELREKPEKKASTEPHMSAETHTFVMSWDKYPEPPTGERQVNLDLHTRLPFSASYQDGAMCLLPEPAQKDIDQVLLILRAHQEIMCLLPAPTQIEPNTGAGFCDGNHYSEKLKHKPGTPLIKERWQTESSKAAWNERAERLHRNEAASVERTVSPEVPHVCVMCKDMNPSKNICKLSEQSMASLCSLHNRHRGLIVTPGNKKQRPYWGSLRQKLDEFEKRNRPAKIWRVSTLPIFNRNDGEFLRYGTNEAGEPIRIYRDSDPRLVPEVAFGHDRTEDSSGYDECAFPDDWQTELAETSGSDDTVFMDINDNSDIKRQCFEMPAPNWVSVTRTRRMFTGEFRTYYTQNKYTELNKVWHWDPVKKFTFTVEEREVVVQIKRAIPIIRTEEYPTLINVQTEEWFTKDIKREAKATGRSEDELRAENTIFVQSSTVVTKRERKYYNAKREEEKQKRAMSGYLILKDVKEGVAKHKWPIRSKRAAAPMVQLPVPAGR